MPPVLRASWQVTFAMWGHPLLEYGAQLGCCSLPQHQLQPQPRTGFWVAMERGPFWRVRTLKGLELGACEGAPILSIDTGGVA